MTKEIIEKFIEGKGTQKLNRLYKNRKSLQDKSEFHKLLILELNHNYEKLELNYELLEAFAKIISFKIFKKNVEIKIKPDDRFPYRKNPKHDRYGWQHGCSESNTIWLNHLTLSEIPTEKFVEETIKTIIHELVHIYLFQKSRKQEDYEHENLFYKLEKYFNNKFRHLFNDEEIILQNL